MYIFKRNDHFKYTLNFKFFYNKSHYISFIFKPRRKTLQKKSPQNKKTKEKNTHKKVKMEKKTWEKNPALKQTQMS
jgi:hypothetical protein